MQSIFVYPLIREYKINPDGTIKVRIEDNILNLPQETFVQLILQDGIVWEGNRCNNLPLIKGSFPISFEPCPHLIYNVLNTPMCQIYMTQPFSKTDESKITLQKLIKSVKCDKLCCKYDHKVSTIISKLQDILILNEIPEYPDELESEDYPSPGLEYDMEGIFVEGYFKSVNPNGTFKIKVGEYVINVDPSTLTQRFILHDKSIWFGNGKKQVFPKEEKDEETNRFVLAFKINMKPCHRLRDTTIDRINKLFLTIDWSTMSYSEKYNMVEEVMRDASCDEDSCKFNHKHDGIIPLVIDWYNTCRIDEPQFVQKTLECVPDGVLSPSFMRPLRRTPTSPGPGQARINEKCRNGDKCWHFRNGKCWYRHDGGGISKPDVVASIPEETDKTRDEIIAYLVEQLKHASLNKLTKMAQQLKA